MQTNLSRYLTAFYLTILWSTSLFAAELDELEYITEIYPPLNYVEGCVTRRGGRSFDICNGTCGPPDCSQKHSGATLWLIYLPPIRQQGLYFSLAKRIIQ